MSLDGSKFVVGCRTHVTKIKSLSCNECNHCWAYTKLDGTKTSRCGYHAIQDPAVSCSDHTAYEKSTYIMGDKDADLTW